MNSEELESQIEHLGVSEERERQARDDWTLILPLLARIVEAMESDPGSMERAAHLLRLRRALSYLASVSRYTDIEEVAGRLETILNKPL